MDARGRRSADRDGVFNDSDCLRNCPRIGSGVHRADLARCLGGALVLSGIYLILVALISFGAYAAPTASAAEPLLSYELDRLFRPARRNPNTETAHERAEAVRILLTSSSHSGVAAEDRTYLLQLVSGVTGLTGPDAERRVDSVVANARTAIARSRRSAVIAAFSIAASILLGAVVAWFAAGEGGRIRDRGPRNYFVEGGRGLP
jgi:hypothetical protein